MRGGVTTSDHMTDAFTKYITYSQTHAVSTDDGRKIIIALVYHGLFLLPVRLWQDTKDALEHLFFSQFQRQYTFNTVLVDAQKHGESTLLGHTTISGSDCFDCTWTRLKI